MASSPFQMNLRLSLHPQDLHEAKSRLCARIRLPNSLRSHCPHCQENVVRYRLFPDVAKEKQLLGNISGRGRSGQGSARGELDVALFLHCRL